MTALEWLDANVDDPLLREVVDIGQTGFFGVDSRNMSAINLLEAFVAPYPGADERYHTHGGNDQIPNGMAKTLDRTAVHLDTPLRALWRRGDGCYVLGFRGVSRPVLADRVVLCLLFTALRDVELSDAACRASAWSRSSNSGWGRTPRTTSNSSAVRTGSGSGPAA